MSEESWPKADLVKLDSHQMAMVEVIAEHEGVRRFIDTGEWIMHNSDIKLNALLARVTMQMKHAETFQDGVKLGFGILGAVEPFTIPADIIDQHVYELNDYRDENEYIHDAAVRLGFSSIEDHPEMVACLQYLLPRLGYANDILFSSGAGYAQVFAEQSARQEFDQDSAQLLEAKFADEMNPSFKNMLRGFDLN